MRIGIIGTGWVGTSVAISLLHDGTARELLLADARHDVAEGEAMDLAQGAPFYPAADVHTADVAAMIDCDAVVVAAGRGGAPGQSRLDLLRDNAAVARDLAPRLARARGVVVVVSNPVDVMTRLVVEGSGLPPARVIGTGTMLDTARLRHALGGALSLDPRSIHAQVVGEHGDSEVVLWSSAEVGGRRLRGMPGWDRAREGVLADGVRTAAGQIIRRKGVTNHAIGLVTATLLRWLLRDERRVLTVSRVQQALPGLPELEGVALSLPAVVDRGGATRIIEPEMDDREREALRASARVLADAHRGISSVA